MAVTLKLFTGGDFSIFLSASNGDTNGDAPVEFDVLLIQSAQHNDVRAELTLKSQLVLSRPYFDLINNNGEVRTFVELADDAGRVALARLRQKLADLPLSVGVAHTFFGVWKGFDGHSQLTANVRLTLPQLGPQPGGKAKLFAEARTGFTVTADLKSFVKADLTGDLALRVEIDEDDVKAALRAVAQNCPSLDIPIEIPDFSALDFEKINLSSIPEFAPISIPVPKIPNLPIGVTWNFGSTPENFDLHVTNGAIALSVGPVQVEVWLNDGIKKTLFDIKDLKVFTDVGRLVVSGEATAGQNVVIDKTYELVSKALPLAVKLQLESVKVDFSSNGPQMLTWDVPRLEIYATSDPTQNVAVALKLKVLINVNGEVDTSVDDIKILDLNVSAPTGLSMQPMDGILRFGVVLGDLQDPGILQFLQRVAGLFNAVAQAVASGLGEIVGWMSDVAKGAAELLGKALAELVEILKEAGQHVAIEVRLDAKTFEPVQIILSPAGAVDVEKYSWHSQLLTLAFQNTGSPAFAIDFRHKWTGMLALYDPKGTLPSVSIGTDLWFSSDDAPDSAIGPLEDKKGKKLLQLTATLKNNRELVLVALQNGRLRALQTFGDRSTEGPPIQNRLVQMVSGFDPLRDIASDDIEMSLDAEGLKDRVVSLLPQGPKDGVLSELSQRVTFDLEKPAEWKSGRLDAPVNVTIKVGDDLDISSEVHLLIDVFALRVELRGDHIDIQQDQEKKITAFGLRLVFVPNIKTRNLFRFVFGNGDFRLELAEGAELQITYDRLSSGQQGLAFKATDFGVGRGGLDLIARVENNPVRLAGIDQPFRFTTGELRIEKGKLMGGTLAGSGPLPPALVGEAIAEIEVVFGRQKGRFAVEAARAKLAKEGEPLYSTGTRFRITIDALGIDFKNTSDGEHHFYFLLTGECAFMPAAGEFDNGIFKRLKSVALRLDEAPLAGDGRELLNHIEFLVEIDPPVTATLFDIFGFELRGIGFHPAFDGFPDRPPAISLAGQVSFLEAGDAVSAEIDFHKLWLAPPDKKSSLPRIRADGLSVLLTVGNVARVEATAVAVDGSLPSLYAPDTLPADVSANGFLAAGRLDIAGLGAYGGAMGFLELRSDVSAKVKHAMFLYGQAEKLTERIDTPIGPLYIREVGLGLGKNFTLAGLAAADRARTPRELVRALDETSKYQGSLTTFKAWTPQYEPDAITLALRGMISMGAASTDSSAYNTDGEKVVANPVLMDIVLALRSDLTFLVNVRAWIAQNYHDWFLDKATADWKERPSLRGYLYFSVPRKELLARMISDPTGVIGIHPALPEPLKTALTSVRFSATTYIRPGLYHMEFGWPYELGFTLENKDGNFWLDVSGGLIFRIEEATALYGIAFRATGGFKFSGQIGSSRFGACAVAKAEFAIGAKFIAYIAPLDPEDTLFYGSVYLNLTMRFSVSIWLSVKVIKRFTIRIRFSISLTISIAAEVVVAATGIGARVHAAVGVRGFGRSLSVGLGFSFGDDQLSLARARVSRFMELGLGIDPPDDRQLAAPAPAIEPKRSKRAERSDTTVGQNPQPAPPQPAPPLEEEGGDRANGRTIGKTDFWALLFEAGSNATTGNRRYIMQLIPRDLSNEATVDGNSPSTFFAEPVPECELENPSTRYADYEVQLSGSVSKVTWLNAEGKTQEIPNKGKLRAQLTKVVGGQDPEGAGLTLNTLLAATFLDAPIAETEDGRIISYGEPFSVGALAPAPTAQSNADQAVRDQSSRWSKADAVTIEQTLAIEERRSTIVNAIGESAMELAQLLATSGTDDLQEVPESKELQAHDFGLTFVVEEDELKGLFEKSGADSNGRPTVKESKKLGISKRFWKRTGPGTGKWDRVEGGVTLLRHPKQNFRALQPRLKDARFELSDEGLKLLWDLEPAWGGSGDRIEDDPETHLAYYRIERSVEGVDLNWIAEFQTKSATAIKYEAKGDVIQMTRSKATVHLVDDFSTGRIPKDVRAMLLGVPIPSGRSPHKIWEDHFSIDAAEVSFVYKIVAVDQMGAETSQRVMEYQLKRPPMPLPGPLASEMMVTYAHGLPNIASDKSPSVQLNIVLRNDKKQTLIDARAARYQLRFRKAELKGGGLYGADAVDDARGHPSQESIEEGAKGLDTDLFLVPVNSETSSEGFTVGFLSPDKPSDKWSESDEEPKYKQFYVLEKAEYDNLVDSTAADFLHIPEQHLRTALGIPAGLADPTKLCASRVFLRRVRNDKKEKHHTDSIWTTVNLMLIVKPVDPEAEQQRPPTHNARVELFEHPLALKFRALDHDYLNRSAGRLELAYPSEVSSLAALAATDAKNQVMRRLDPARRSAIELEFNAMGGQIEGLSDSDPAAVASLVAGFDVFELDPARVRVQAYPKDDLAEKIAGHARFRSTIKVLPRSLTGLFPDVVSDFKTIDVRYPSETYRTNPVRAGERKRAPWYSKAESQVAFPQPRLRRGLFPTPDEAWISWLLDDGNTTSITVELTPRSSPDTNDLTPEQRQIWDEIFEALNDKVYPKLDTSDKEITKYWKIETGQFVKHSKKPQSVSAADLRALLRSLIWAAEADQLSPDTLYAKWREAGSDPAIIGAFTLDAVCRRGGADAKLEHREAKMTIDLHGALHPVLAETLSNLMYTSYEVNQEHPGAVFRGYEAVREPSVRAETNKFAAFLDAFPESSDPYGWGALRAMGLAAGLRLYDTDGQRYLSGQRLYDTDGQRYLSGQRLIERLYKAMQQSVERYAENSAGMGDNLGSPFVELVDLPEAFMATSSFDGRDASRDDDGERIRKGGTSIVQISLRPRTQGHLQDNPSVRYLILKRPARRMNQGIDDELPKIDFGPGATHTGLVVHMLDVANATDGARLQTLAAESTAKYLGLDKVLSYVQFTSDTLTSLPPSEIVAYLRVAAIVPVPEIDPTEFWKNIRTSLLAPFGELGDLIEATNWIDHPEDAADGPFDSFPPLEGNLLAALQFPNNNGQMISPSLNSLAANLPPGHAPPMERLPIMPEAGSVNDENQTVVPDRVGTVAQHIADWTARFLRHASADARKLNGTPVIRFALASLTNEMSLARVPDANGVVRAFFIDPSRNGRELFFAVRPFGRYSEIQSRIEGKGPRRPTLDHALNEVNPESHFVSVSLPRSRPLAKPTILHAGRQKRAGAKDTDLEKIDLMIGRTSDQIIGAANIPAERALQPGWTALELRRNFPGRERARVLLNDKNYDGLEPFPNDETGEVLTGEVLGPDDLVEISKVAPDAWRGALHYSFDHLPHFMQLTAMAHQSAGVVVSEISTAPLPRADFLLRLPPLLNGPEATNDPRVPWGRGPRPNWAIGVGTLLDVDTNVEQAWVDFTLPLIRNLDLMSNAALGVWTGRKLDNVPQVMRLPDDEASYRISLLSQDGSSEAPQLEILPTRVDNGCPKELYACAAVAGRFNSASQSGTIVKTTPVDVTNGAEHWLLLVRAPFATARLPVLTDPDDIAGKFDSFRLADPGDAPQWERLSPRRKVVFSATPIGDFAGLQADIAEYENILATWTQDSQVAGLLNKMVVLKAVGTQAEWEAYIQQFGPTIDCNLPIGLGDLPRLLRFGAAAVPPYSWPDEFGPVGPDRWPKARDILAASNQPDLVQRFLEMLRNDWISANKPRPLDGIPVMLAPQSADMRPVDISPQVFGFLQVYEYKFGTGDPEAEIMAVRDVLVEKLSADPTGLAQALDQLANVDVIVRDGKAQLSVSMILLQISTRGRPDFIGDPNFSISGTPLIALFRPPTPTDWLALNAIQTTQPKLVEAFQKLAHAQLFGDGTTVRMTAFKGDKRPVRVKIDQRLSADNGGQ